MKKNIFLIALIFIMSFYMNTNARDLNKMIDEGLSRLGDSVKNISDIKVIAVNVFEYSKDVEVRNVEEKVVKQIARLGKFKVVDRRALDILLKEQSLSLSGVTEPVEMKKVGKMINVDAFLFGKVYLTGYNIVINLEIREVSTGAIIWSEEFIGEDPDYTSLGLGIRLGTYNSSAQTYVAGSGLKEYANIQSRENAMYVAFLFHFVQRMAFSKGLSFGVDGIFSRGDWQIDRFDDPVLNKTYNLYQTSTYTDYNFTLIPLVRFHPAYLLGWKNDVIVLYAGAGLSADFVELKGTFRLKKNDLTSDTGEINYRSVNLNPGNFAYKFGVEVRFTDNFSMFFEFYQLPNMTMKFEDVNVNIAPQVTVQSKLYYGLGGKYYFFGF